MKIFIVALYLSIAAGSSFGDGADAPEIQLKEKTAVYHQLNFNRKKNSYSYYSVEMPAGFILTNCIELNGFLKGKKCSQEIFDKVEFRAILKNGDARFAYGDVYAAELDISKFFPKIKNFEERKRRYLQEQALPYDERYRKEIISQGEIKAAEWQYGYYSIWRRVDLGQAPRIQKYVAASPNSSCLIGGEYHEKDLKTGEELPPNKWKFENIFDEIVRSVKCLEVPRAVVEQKTKKKAAKRKWTQSPKKN